MKWFVKEYSNLQLLGVGGYSHVYIGERNKDGKRFALKVLKKKSTYLLEREVCILKKIHHNFICKYIDMTIYNNQYTLVLEYIKGVELYEIMFEKQMNQKCILFTLACILSCMMYLHDLRIIYRDLKPENIVMNEHGYAILVDFGLAKYIPNNYAVTYCGTPLYMAPEMKTKKRYSYPVDMYAFGVLMYELYTRETPFHSKVRIPKHVSICLSNLLSHNSLDRKTATALRWSSLFCRIDFDRLENKWYDSPIKKPQVDFPITA